MEGGRRPLAAPPPPPQALEVKAMPKLSLQAVLFAVPEFPKPPPVPKILIPPPSRCHRCQRYRFQGKTKRVRRYQSDAQARDQALKACHRGQENTSARGYGLRAIRAYSTFFVTDSLAAVPNAVHAQQQNNQACFCYPACSAISPVK